MGTELLVDIGHSRLKWGLARNGRLDEHTVGRAEAERADALLQAAARNRVARAIVCGQSRPEAVTRLVDRIAQSSAQVDIITTGDRALPVDPAYAELGCDRWLALQWPWLSERAPVVVVDCGTAITIDVVDGGGRHRGGWIMAGVRAARSGLLTAAPGLARPPADTGAAGKPARDTAGAVARGSALMAAGGIERAVASAESAIEEHVSLWLTGGDAAGIGPLIERAARHDRHLVLRGLAMATQSK